MLCTSVSTDLGAVCKMWLKWQMIELCISVFLRLPSTPCHFKPISTYFRQFFGFLSLACAYIESFALKDERAKDSCVINYTKRH